MNEKEISLDGVLKEGSSLKFNHKNLRDGVELLQNINNSQIKACFFDPQYRGVLDKLSYGNEGEKRGKARCDLPQMPEEIIISFIQEISRVLVPSGHLFLWIDKFHLCEGCHSWLKDTELQIVDLIVWDKMRIGMGYRTRRKSEYCLVLQKKPIKAKGVWVKHNIPDVWQEKVEGAAKRHPHSKPISLQQTLIEAVSEPHDIIVDPASGGFSVFEACQNTGRIFLGGDLVYGDAEEY